MGTVRYIAKAANPEQLSWRARIARNEKPLLAGFLAWAAEVRAQITETAIAHAVLARGVQAFDHILQAIAFEPALAIVAEPEAAREFDRIIHELEPRLHLSFDLHDPNFTGMVQQEQARLVREVTDETRRAIANLIDRAYRQGLHPYEVAPQIREMVGLTARQAQAVLNYRAGLVKAGRRPEQVARMTDRYAARMLKRRGQTIARTETARAMTQARIASYLQAAQHGLFDVAQAELEWSSVQTDPEEICAQLDGERVPLGSTFDGLIPPAHPNCRCSLHLVIGH